jgi:hypothetical protein
MAARRLGAASSQDGTFSAFSAIRVVLSVQA